MNFNFYTSIFQPHNKCSFSLVLINIEKKYCAGFLHTGISNPNLQTLQRNWFLISRNFVTSFQIRAGDLPMKSAVYIPEDFSDWSSKSAISQFYRPYVESVMITDAQIKQRVKELAAEIDAFYAKDPITLLCVLKV